MRASSPEPNPWLRRFAWFTAASTLLLICSGGMVTSKGVGLAVPDWPTTFGYNMFLFPLSKWVGGILFEHTHRLLASTTGFLTIILAVWLWKSGAPRWLRNLGWMSLGAVVLQGILGGLRVTMLKDEIGIFHACLAQAFLGMLVVIALATSALWRSIAEEEKNISSRSVVAGALIVTFLIYGQLILGATMRHQHRDLAITDFPSAYGQIIPDTNPAALAGINAWREARALSEVTASQIWLQMSHRFLAAIIAGAIAAFWFVVRAQSKRVSVLRRLSNFWLTLVLLQIVLGGWTIWSNKAADIATAHVALGAILFSIGVALCALSFRLRQSRGNVRIFERPRNFADMNVT
jgi:heme a synthase